MTAAAAVAMRVVVAVIALVTGIAVAGTYVLLDQASGTKPGDAMARFPLFAEQLLVVAMALVMVVRNLRGPRLGYLVNLTFATALALAVVRGVRSHDGDVVTSFGGTGRGDWMQAAQIAGITGAVLVVLLTLGAAAVREDQAAHLPDRQNLAIPTLFHAVFCILAIRWAVLDPASVSDPDRAAFRELGGNWVMVAVLSAIAIASVIGYRVYAAGGSRATVIAAHVLTLAAGVFVVLYNRSQIDEYAVQAGFESGVWEALQAVSTWAAIGISIGALMIIAVAPVLERALAPARDAQLI